MRFSKNLIGLVFFVGLLLIYSAHVVLAEKNVKQLPYLEVYSKPNCPACEDFEKVLTQISEKYPDKIDFFVYNTKEPANRKRVLKYDIKGTPTLVFFDKEGNMLELHKGKLTLEELLITFQKHNVDF